MRFDDKQHVILLLKSKTSHKRIKSAFVAHNMLWVIGLNL